MTKKQTTPEAEEAAALSLDDMTYGELETFEEIIGFIPETEDDMAKVPKMKMGIALAFVMGRRKNPELTLDEVRAAKVGSFVTGFEDAIVDPSSDEEEGAAE